MNFTASKDGKKRASIRIEHRIGLFEIACAVALDFWDQRDEVTLTRQKAEQSIRTHLWTDGADFTMFGPDDFGTDCIDEVMDWALNEVERLFPDLVEG